MLEDKDGKLVANLHETWRLAHEDCAANLSAMRDKIDAAKGEHIYPADDQAASALFNMVVTRYCRRPKEYAATMRVRRLFVSTAFLVDEADKVKPVGSLASDSEAKFQEEKSR